MARIPIGIYPGRIAEWDGTTYDGLLEHKVAIGYGRIYYTNAWQGVLLEETGDLDRRKAIVSPYPQQSMEIILKPRKDL